MSEAEKILREIEESGKKSFIPVIGPVKGKILEDTVKAHKPKIVLEIGTLIGYSAILMARLLPEGGKIISIEIDGNSAKVAQRNIEHRAGFSDKIEVMVGDAKKIIPTLKEVFDLVFIDAAKDEYLIYLKLAEEKMHRGSIVVADNAGIFADQMADYLSYVRIGGKYVSKYHESTLEFNDSIKDGVEVSIRI